MGRRFWAAGVVVSLLAVGLVGCSSGADADTPVVDGVYDVCKQFVEDRLAYPGSSDFQGIDDADITLNGNSGVEVSYVDAANAFGAQSRRPFTCRVRYEGNGGWHLRGLDIDLD
jgi:hypothetical protein